MHDAACLLAAACGPPLRHRVEALTEDMGKSECGTGWKIWRAQYAGLLIDSQLGIATLVQKLQWAKTNITDKDVVINLVSSIPTNWYIGHPVEYVWCRALTSAPCCTLNPRSRPAHFLAAS